MSGSRGRPDPVARDYDRIARSYARELGDELTGLEQRGQLVRRLHERPGDVDSADLAPEALREVAGRATDSAADVQQVVAGLDGQPIRELDGRGKATSVEVVDRRQVLHR